MKCPNCGYENKNGIQYCCACGTIQSFHPQTENQKLPMKFHIFYCITIFLVAIVHIVFALLLLKLGSIWDCIMPLILSGFMVTTGILLLCKKKIGKVFNIIYNIMSYILSLLYIGTTGIASLFMFLIAGMIKSGENVDGLLGLLYGFGIGGFLLVSVACLLIVTLNIVSLVYYKKRKHLFT